MLYLKYQHGVYFPWKVCYHLLENDRWEDKHSGEGKDFSEERRAPLPETVAFVKSLPFTEIGRVVLFGIEANDHAPMHRDSEPGKTLTIPHSISFDPARQQALRAHRQGPGDAAFRSSRAPTGSTTWITTASRPIRSSATRSGSTACSTQNGCRGCGGDSRGEPQPSMNTGAERARSSVGPACTRV